MDGFKDTSSDMMNTSVVELLEDISFPASKAEVLQHLEVRTRACHFTCYQYR